MISPDALWSLAMIVGFWTRSPLIFWPLKEIAAFNGLKVIIKLMRRTGGDGVGPRQNSLIG